MSTNYKSLNNESESMILFATTKPNVSVVSKSNGDKAQNVKPKTDKFYITKADTFKSF